MQKSFKQRLAALERLEAAIDPIAHPGDLTDADCAVLVGQASLSNVELLPDGRVVRHWPCNGADVTAALDLALRRCNVQLAVSDDPPRTTAELVNSLVEWVPYEAIPAWMWGLLCEKFLAEETL